MSQDESTLGIDSIHFSKEFSLNEGQKKIIEDIISWKTQPPLVKTGKSSYLIIDEPTLPFKGIKVKGCGYFDPYSSAVMQPLTQDDAQEIHLQTKVNDKDELIFVVPKPNPFGAQIYDSAITEYEACKTLYENFKGDDYPFYYPLAYAKYEDMQYNDKPLGVSVLGISCETELSMGSYFSGQFEEEGLRIQPQLLDYWQNHLAAAGQTEPTYFDILNVLNKLNYELGKSLAMLHQHFVDHDSHLLNCAVNKEKGFVMIYDLDHVLDIKKLSDQKYFYYCMKDFEIALVAIMSNFLLSGYAEGVLLFEKTNMQIDDYNILDGFFEGYFGELTDEIKYETKLLWKGVLLTAADLTDSPHSDHLNKIGIFCEQQSESSYYGIYPFMKDKIMRFRPDFNLSKEEHIKIVDKFLEQKSEISKAHNVTT